MINEEKRIELKTGCREYNYVGPVEIRDAAHWNFNAEMDVGEI